jgi:hypothetical protein
VSLFIISLASYSIKRASAIFLTIIISVIILFAVFSLSFFCLQQDIISFYLVLRLLKLSDFDL